MEKIKKLTKAKHTQEIYALPIEEAQTHDARGKVFYEITLCFSFCSRTPIPVQSAFIPTPRSRFASSSMTDSCSYRLGFWHSRGDPRFVQRPTRQYRDPRASSGQSS